MTFFRKSMQLLFLAALMLHIPKFAAAQPGSLPVFGQQTATNRYLPRLVPVYKQDFEKGAADCFFFGSAQIMPPGSGLALSGSRSVRIPGSPGGFVILPTQMGLEPDRNYVIEYRYRVLSPGVEKHALSVAVLWNGLEVADGVLGGPIAGQYPAEGSERHAIRIAKNVNDAMFIFFSSSADILLDEITVYRYDNIAVAAEIPMVTAGFPRLGKYSLLSTYVTALNTGASLTQIEDTLSLFDLVTGVDIDHTWGPTGWVDRLRAKNPNLLLLPYFQAFVAQYPDEKPLGGSAKLRQLFTDGLYDDWYMMGPAGGRLEEPRYPGNFQLNHTDRAPVIDGTSYIDYVGNYLSRSVLPSGRWNGIHFDQVEWYPNPLLGTGDPFLGGINSMPPIDLNRDGVAESSPDLHTAWRSAFEEYFRSLRRQVGNTQLFMGNAGYVPANPTILSYLNGWQREFTMPYPTGADGDWKIDAMGGWYRLMNNLTLANRYARAPQLINLQFTGFGLGTPTGRLTANGLNDRLPILEPRDFRRMRFGLATALLSDSFYAYDYVDNTTAPVWFDEYAIDGDGRPVAALSGKGYLGQPLGEASEISDARTEVFNLDFERLPPEYVDFGHNFRLTTTPGEVISGNQSIVFDLNDTSTDWGMLRTHAEKLPLEPGQTYHLELDYKLLDHRPISYVGLFIAGITDTGGRRDDLDRFAAVLYPDIDTVGQTGHLRTAVKPDNTDFFVRLEFADRATIAMDNIRLTRGAGGVFRRDFEHGIVLINPTPEEVFVPQAAVAGPLNRTAIRRIRGVQDPVWNDGSPVTGGISIRPGDAIILLSDAIAAPVAGKPTGLKASAAGTTVDLSWEQSTGTVAGYLIRYGESGADLIRTAVARQIPHVTIESLEPGTDYLFYVTPFDYLGRTLADYAMVSAKTGGQSVAGRPNLDFSQGRPTLIPGAAKFISGTYMASSSQQVATAPFSTQLAGTRVTVNGVPAALFSVEPNMIGFFVPWEVGGDNAVLRVEVGSAASAEALLPVRIAQPYIWTWDGLNAILLHSSDGLPINASRPARGGERLRLIATGLGLIAPSPENGTMPSGSIKLANPAKVSVDGVDTEVLAVSNYDGLLDTYAIDFVAPVTTSGGDKPIFIQVNDIRSNPGSALFQ